MTSAYKQLLTKREQEILFIVTSTTQSLGHFPSYRELMHLLGLSSPATVYKHIQNIKSKGYLGEKPDSRRVLSTDNSPSSTENITIAIIGSIAKGEKLHFFTTVSLCNLPGTLISKEYSSYGFVAQNNSFITSHIKQGDLLVVQTRKEPKLEELVLIQHKKEGLQLGHYRQNSFQNSYIVTAERNYHAEDPDLQIQGIITFLFRNFGQPSDTKFLATS